jgi:hypothetical protein
MFMIANGAKHCGGAEIKISHRAGSKFVARVYRLFFDPSEPPLRTGKLPPLAAAMASAMGQDRPNAAQQKAAIHDDGAVARCSFVTISF